MRHYHGKTANFFYDSDFVGEVIITVNPDSNEAIKVKVDAEDILGLVANHLRSELIGEIESMDSIELLSLIKKR